MGTRRRSVATGIAAALGAIVLAFLVSMPVHSVQVIDSGIAAAVNRAVAPHHGLITFWTTVTTIGSPVTWDVCAAIVAGVLCWKRRFRMASVVVGAVAGAGILSTVLKVVVARSRPTVPTPVAYASGMSFPSGHALTSAVAIGVFLLLLPPLRPRARRSLLLASAVVVAAVGFSRLILGVHYLTDVLAAWLIAVVWLAVIRGLLTFARQRDCACGRATRPRAIPPDEEIELSSGQCRVV